MASLKELRIRINSVKSTQKITKAMQMVASSKLRRAQESAEAARSVIRPPRPVVECRVCQRAARVRPAAEFGPHHRAGQCAISF